MRKVSKRFRGERAVEGPMIGAFLSADGLTVRVIANGERPTLPRATVKATDDSRAALIAAARIVASRIVAAATREVDIAVLV